MSEINLLWTQTVLKGQFAFFYNVCQIFRHCCLCLIRFFPISLKLLEPHASFMKNNHSIREISRLREFICVSHEMQSLQLNSDSCLAEIRRKLRNKFVNINHSDLPKYDSVRSTIDPRIRLAKQQGYTDIKFHRCTNNDDFEDILSVTKTWTCRLLISKIEKKDSLCVELK